MPTRKKRRMTTPVDDYFDSRDKHAAGVKEDDANLVLRWQQQQSSGVVDPNLNEQVFRRFEPVRRAAVNRFKAPLAGPGFDTKSRTLVAGALASWRPEGGAAPATHVTNHLRRLYRENLQQHSVASTEADASLFGHLDNARNELVDELERDPTPHELLGRINEIVPAHKRIDLARLQQLQSRRGGTALSSSFEATPQQFQANADQQTLGLLPYDLNEQERTVYNHLFGQGGQRPSTSTGTIAKRMGVSAPTVSRLRKSIAAKAGVPLNQLTSARRKGTY